MGRQKSSSSYVKHWPDRDEVHAAVAHWSHELRFSNPNVRRVGYIGSYARGDWGPGSDIDLVVLVASAAAPLERSKDIDALALPVPADLLIFTEEEWEQLSARRIRREPIVWITD